MDAYEETNDPNSIGRLRVHSEVLPWLVGAFAAVVVLVAVGLMFWTVAHPRSTLGANNNEEIVGPSGYYSTEGGHDPVQPFGSTRNELKFRGDTTQPIPTPPSATQRR
jgi:hypothetical protein